MNPYPHLKNDEIANYRLVYSGSLIRIIFMTGRRHVCSTDFYFKFIFFDKFSFNTTDLTLKTKND